MVPKRRRECKTEIGRSFYDGPYCSQRRGRGGRPTAAERVAVPLYTVADSGTAVGSRQVGASRAFENGVLDAGRAVVDAIKYNII
jgi:hypothetical protein